MKTSAYLLTLCMTTAIICLHSSCIVRAGYRPPPAPKAKVTPAKKDTLTEISWPRTEHDFGLLKQGEVVETSFTCYNGADTLVLENVMASCGCVAPDWKRTPILPYDSTEIKVVFDTKGKSGKHNKVITVYTNRGLYELIIKANIKND